MIDPDPSQLTRGLTATGQHAAGPFPIPKARRGIGQETAAMKPKCTVRSAELSLITATARPSGMQTRAS